MLRLPTHQLEDLPHCHDLDAAFPEYPNQGKIPDQVSVAAHQIFRSPEQHRFQDNVIGDIAA